MIDYYKQQYSGVNKPNMRQNPLMPSAPQSPFGGAGGQLTGTQMAGEAPSLLSMMSAQAPQAQSNDSRDRLTQALLAKSGQSLQQGASVGGAPAAGMSAMGGALQGASLASMATGKSPFQMAGKAMGFGQKPLYMQPGAAASNKAEGAAAGLADSIVADPAARAKLMDQGAAGQLSGEGLGQAIGGDGAAQLGSGADSLLSSATGAPGEEVLGSMAGPAAGGSDILAQLAAGNPEFWAANPEWMSMLFGGGELGGLGAGMELSGAGAGLWGGAEMGAELAPLLFL
jgi:hypothetical protein